jgi:hypothetical protein
MRFWWALQDGMFDLVRTIGDQLRVLAAWCLWRKRKLIRALKPTWLSTLFAVLSSIATVCAAAASVMSYMVSRDSQRVAGESLAITKAIDARSQLQQRAVVTVRNASIGQYGIQDSQGSEITAVTTISLSLRNSGHNPAGWVRLRGGAFFTESVESRNSMSNDSEQLFVLEFKNLKIDGDTKLHFGFEYWDEELKKCFYGKVEYKLARDPKNPKEFMPTPYVTGEADEDIRRLKEDGYCTRFTKAANEAQP